MKTRVEPVIARMQAGLAQSDNGSYAAVTLSCEETKTLLAALAACGTPQQEQEAQGSGVEPPESGCSFIGGSIGREHELKTWPVFFEEVITGRKRFEIRENDRDYHVGDVLLLNEYDPERGYSGRSARFVITYLTTWKQEARHVVLGLSDPLPVTHRDSRTPPEAPAPAGEAKRRAMPEIEAQLAELERHDPGFIEAVKAYYGVPDLELQYKKLLADWREQDEALQRIHAATGIDGIVSCPADVAEHVDAALAKAEGSA